jgi:hypothetical protein
MLRRAPVKKLSTQMTTAPSQQAFAKMRSKKASPARDQDAFLKVHDSRLSKLVSTVRGHPSGNRQQNYRLLLVQRQLHKLEYNRNPIQEV